MSVQYFGSTDTSGGEDPVGSYLTPAWARNGDYITGFTCPGSGSMTIKELQVYCRLSSGTGNMRMAVYSAAHALIAQTDEIAVSTTAGWQGPTNLSLGPLTGGVQYDLAYSYDVSTFGIWCMIGSMGDVTFGGADYTGGFPASLADGTDWDRMVAIRCGVEEAAVAGHPVMKRWGGVPFVGLNRGVW